MNLFAANLVFALLLFAGGASASPHAFIGASVVDPASGTVMHGATVVTRGSRIESISVATRARLPRGTRRIDARGLYLAPGLAEMHAHVPLAREGETYRDDLLFLWVANGVTTIRGMRGEASHLELRAALAAGEILGPRLVTAGPPLIGDIGTPGEARALVAAQAAAGYDLVKVHMGLSRDAYLAAAAAAREAGLPFAGHVAQAVGLGVALGAGQHSIEHLDGYLPAMLPAGTNDLPYGLMGAPMLRAADPDRILPLAQRTRLAGTWNAPTLTMVENFLRAPGENLRPGLEYMPPRTVRGWQAAVRGYQRTDEYDAATAPEFLRLRSELVRALRDAGAGILLASDAPQIMNVPGFSTHEELAALVAAGLSPAEALRAGTSDAARALGLADEFGAIRPGLAADLVLVNGNPLTGVETLRRPAGVMVRGRWLARAELDAGLASLARRQAAE